MMPINITKQLIARLLSWLLVAVAFSFPFGRKFTSVLLVILFLLFVVYAWCARNEILKNSLDVKSKYSFLLPIAYYVLCIIGLIHSSNLAEGIFELDKKVMLAALPLFFLGLSAQLHVSTLVDIMKGFVAGMVLCALISIGLGFYHSTRIVDGQVIFRTAVNDFVYARGDSFFEQVTQGGNYFFGNYISPFIHTNYYGVYLSVGSAIAFYFFLLNRKNFRYLLAAVLLFCVLVLCDARGPVIAFLVTLPTLVVVGVRNRLAKAALPVLIALIIGIMSLSPRTALLFSDLRYTIEHVDYHSTESTMLRLIVWDAAIDIIKDNWLFGVGTGDREEEMLEVTMKKNKAAFEQELNAHNQYLEAFLTLGIAGILVVTAMIVFPLASALSQRHLLFSAFLLIVGINMLFESMLQVFQGIVFISFFYCVLILHANRHIPGTQQ